VSTETVERNKEVVTRLFEAFRARDASDQLIVEDYVQHNPRSCSSRCQRRP
jgi:predicted SnoaL-like aldol condensation-catalyzing enzyme